MDINIIYVTLASINIFIAIIRHNKVSVLNIIAAIACYCAIYLRMR